MAENMRMFNPAIETMPREQMRELQLERLKAMGKPFIARVPLIPGVNDTPENMAETARWLRGARALERVELLRYNRAAGAKYARLGREYAPGIDESAEPRVFTEAFEACGIEVTVS